MGGGAEDGDCGRGREKGGGGDGGGRGWKCAVLRDATCRLQQLARLCLPDPIPHEARRKCRPWKHTLVAT